MAAPRSRRCSLSLLTLFSITLILISVSLFVSTKPANKPFLDYRNQFSTSISISSPLEQNTTNTSFVSASPPLSPLGQSNTTNTILASSSSSSSFSDHQNQNKSPSPTSKKIVIRVCNHSFSLCFFLFQVSQINNFVLIKLFFFLILFFVKVNNNLYFYFYYDQKRSGLDKIESDLAKARAAIKKAASTQNYVSSLYKNPAAFHQLSFAILLLLLFLTI